MTTPIHCTFLSKTAFLVHSIQINAYASLAVLVYGTMASMFDNSSRHAICNILKEIYCEIRPSGRIHIIIINNNSNNNSGTRTNKKEKRKKKKHKTKQTSTDHSRQQKVIVDMYLPLIKSKCFWRAFLCGLDWFSSLHTTMSRHFTAFFCSATFGDEIIRQQQWVALTWMVSNFECDTSDKVLQTCDVGSDTHTHTRCAW